MKRVLVVMAVVSLGGCFSFNFDGASCTRDDECLNGTKCDAATQACVRLDAGTTGGGGVTGGGGGVTGGGGGVTGGGGGGGVTGGGGGVTGGGGGVTGGSGGGATGGGGGGGTFCVTDAGEIAAGTSINGGCTQCDLAGSPFTRPNDTACDLDAGFCQAGACVDSCKIAGATYLAGTPRPGVECQVCRPETSRTDWSSQAKGESCGAGAECWNALCVCKTGLVSDSPTPFCTDGDAGVDCATTALEGQDGLHQGPLPTFSLSGGVVRDQLTGLEWQQVASGPMVGADAGAYCVLDGGGWRVPTVHELVGIADYGRSPPVHDPTWFRYWGGTPLVTWARDQEGSNFFYFLSGPLGVGGYNPGAYLLTTSPATQYAAARCVRDSNPVCTPPAQRFVLDVPNDTVTDHQTGLIWRRDSSGVANWAGALDWCSRQSNAVRSWRLPTVKELESIYGHFAAVMSPLDTNFMVGAAAEWTSTPVLSAPANVWVLVNSDHHGLATYLPSSSPDAGARCVHGPDDP